MKKLVSTLAVVALLFTMSANAQEKISKRKKAKTEKAAAVSGDKKECSTTEKKGAACCAHKAEAKS